MKNPGKKYPLIFGAAAFIVMYSGIMSVYAKGSIPNAILRFILSALAFLIMWPAAKSEWLEFPGSGWKKAFSFYKWIFIITGIFVVVVIGAAVIVSLVPELSDAMGDDGTGAFDSRWPVNVLKLIVLYMSVGIVEELAVRRGLFYLGMKQFPDKKNTVMVSALVSSFIFGFMHVALDLSSDPSAIASAVVKTVQAGMLGFIMCAIVIESKNIWTVAAIHALNDLIPGIISAFIMGIENTGYVSSAETFSMWLRDNAGTSLFILIYIPFVIKAVKKLKEYKTFPQQFKSEP